ncbi:MAG: homoserine kinase [Scytolyngbya sp. HA4215-MV1]|jgi:homoserine kinase|nr:homoserine kinase [Scytolyngbya sp. HA4215-MV1]
MSAVSTVTVTVPATTANLGPGFDCLGAALTLYNRFQFSALPEESTPVKILVQGEEADRVDPGASNLAYQAFAKLYHHLGQTPPPVQIEINLGVPLARGLGSSATAIVGGLIGANRLAGSPLDQIGIMQLAIAMEGHPDNVVPALIGGCRLATRNPDDPWTISEIPWHSAIIPVIAIPNFELSTQAARQVLPDDYSRADAIFTAAHLGLLIRGLETGQGDWLQTALHDRLHQPYRQLLIPGYATVRSAAMAAGAYGMVISGAGPTLLALTDALHATAVATAMSSAWAQHNIEARVECLQIETQGVAIA